MGDFVDVNKVQNGDHGRLVVECAGVIADAETRSIFALGHLLPVTAVFYNPATVERPGTDRISTPAGRAATELVYQTPERIAAAVKRPIPATSESLHFNVVCENGWWVEVAVWPEDDALSFGLPPEGCDPLESGDAVGLLALLAEASTRSAYVPTDEYDNPWAGLARGEWVWEPGHIGGSDG